MRSNTRWLIPQKHTLTTTEECNKLLNSGYTLINNMGFTVSLNTNGTQNKSNKNRSRAYKFSTPQIWQVLDTEKSNDHITVLMNTKSIWFKLETWVLWLSNKIL